MTDQAQLSPKAIANQEFLASINGTTVEVCMCLKNGDLWIGKVPINVDVSNPRIGVTEDVKMVIVHGREMSPEILIQQPVDCNPDHYAPDYKWRLNKRGHRDYRCSIWYHVETDRELRVADGMGETAQEAVDSAVNMVRARSGKPSCSVPDDAKASSERLAAQVRASFEESMKQVEKTARELDGKMTPAERAAQRESFAFGNANASNPEVTREMVREAIAKEDEAE